MRRLRFTDYDPEDQSIIYDTLHGLADGLRRLAAHPAVAVLRVKNRFPRPGTAPVGSSNFERSSSTELRVQPVMVDASAVGGYRDVAVNLLLEGPAAVAAGASGHVCEVQLQLLAVARQRSEAGHRRYIAYRNGMGT